MIKKLNCHFTLFMGEKKILFVNSQAPLSYKLTLFDEALFMYKLTLHCSFIVEVLEHYKNTLFYQILKKVKIAQLVKNVPHCRVVNHKSEDFAKLLSSIVKGLMPSRLPHPVKKYGCLSITYFHFWSEHHNL